MLERYRGAARAVAEAVSSLSASDLDRALDGGWTLRQIVHHIADIELVEGVRLRRILAEDNPDLPWIDEAEQARRLHSERTVETSVGVFQSTVLANASLLERLGEDEWLRSGTLAGIGSYSVEDWLRKLSEHAHEHAAQLLRAAGRDLP